MIMLINLYNGIVAKLSRYMCRPNPRNPDPCLTDLEVANLIDDTISRKKKRRLYAHMHQCANCYVLWSESAAFVKTAPDRLVKSSAVETAAKTSSIPAKWLSPLIWTPAIGTAAIVLLTLWTGSSQYPDKIDSAYVQLASVENRRFEQLATELEAQTQTNTMAFSPATASDPQRAFAAGLHDGVELLKRLNSTPKPPVASSTWNQAIANDYYQLGRWVALAWLSIRVQTTDSNRTQLEGILVEIRSRLTQQADDSRDKTAALEQIGQLQSALQQAPPTQRNTRKALRQALTMAIAKLAP